MTAVARSRFVLAAATFAGLLAGASLVCADETQIVFDLPPAIECGDVTSPQFAAVHPTMKVVEGKLRISARVAGGSEEKIVDFLYEIANPARSMRFQDYLPNTLLESAVADDQIEITDNAENCKTTGAEARVAYKLFSLGANHNQSSKKSELSRYRQIAAKELVLASGTTNREHGVFYRLRPSRSASLEGAKEFTFLAKVPKTWRGDVCTISCAARAEHSSLFSKSVAAAGAVCVQVPVCLVGDAEAAELVKEFRRAQDSHAVALAAYQQEGVLDTLSNHAVGLFTLKKCESPSAIELDKAAKALAEAEKRLTDLAR
jgi:hypothetical protein